MQHCILLLFYTLFNLPLLQTWEQCVNVLNGRLILNGSLPGRVATLHTSAALHTFQSAITSALEQCVNVLNVRLIPNVAALTGRVATLHTSALLHTFLSAITSDLEQCVNVLNGRLILNVAQPYLEELHHCILLLFYTLFSLPLLQTWNSVLMY